MSKCTTYKTMSSSQLSYNLLAKNKKVLWTVQKLLFKNIASWATASMCLDLFIPSTEVKW